MLEKTVKNKRWETFFIGVAELSAKMSYCKRLQVGAVLVGDKRILANTWNGTVSGKSNNCEDTTYRCNACDCDITTNTCNTCGAEGVGYIKTNPFTIHAEQNLIANCAKNGIKMSGCDVYVTHSPCKECSKLLAQSGIDTVYYKNEYKDTSGLTFLVEAGVKVKKINT